MTFQMNISVLFHWLNCKCTSSISFFSSTRTHTHTSVSLKYSTLFHFKFSRSEWHRNIYQTQLNIFFSSFLSFALFLHWIDFSLIFFFHFYFTFGQLNKRAAKEKNEKKCFTVDLNTTSSWWWLCLTYVKMLKHQVVMRRWAFANCNQHNIFCLSVWISTVWHSFVFVLRIHFSIQRNSLIRNMITTFELIYGKNNNNESNNSHEKKKVILLDRHRTKRNLFSFLFFLLLVVAWGGIETRKQNILKHSSSAFVFLSFLFFQFVFRPV